MSMRRHGHDIQNRLNLIGATRWWSKHECPQKIFGTFEDGSSGMFCDVNVVLYCVSTSENLSVKVRFDGSVMLDNMIRYQHVLTAIIYQRIIEINSALSKYLQTSGLGFINVFNMMEATKKDIQQVHRDFAIVVTKTDHFVQHVNDVLEKRGCDVLIESSFPAKRVRKSKNEPLDECLLDSIKKFEVDVHNRILDQVVQSLDRRFATHKKLYADLNYFDPKRFSETFLHGISISAVNMICNLLPNKSSDSSVQQDLRQELLDFASKWPESKKILPEHCIELQVIIFLILLLINYLQVNVRLIYNMF